MIVIVARALAAVANSSVGQSEAERYWPRRRFSETTCGRTKIRRNHELMICLEVGPQALA
jgi:hypothetical protein